MRLRNVTPVVVALTIGSLAAWAASWACARPQDAEKPLVAIGLGSAAPKGATILFAGRGDDIAANWQKRDGSGPSAWKVEGGAMTPVWRHRDEGRVRRLLSPRRVPADR